MHEYILADRVLQSVLEFMNKQGLSSVSIVDVDVGELLGLEGDSLSMAYGILSKGTKAEGSKLKVHRIKGTVICSKCGYEGSLKHIPNEHLIDPAFACPSCGSPVSIKAGNDVKLNLVS
jgi:hydrogenase nickel incorporation protein HypA/HybF